MVRVCVLAVLAGLVVGVNGLAVEMAEKTTDAVFVLQPEADAVLHRRRRYNSGHLEEIHQGNLERECREESCSFEEAREIFEDVDKTMDFWASYIDGNQCEPLPCQNGGSCQDGVSNYLCWCKPSFTGKNCEIELNNQCTVNNGGCSHFCMMRHRLPVCSCAAGYKLGSDKRSCEPKDSFSCGLRELPSSDTRSILNPRSSKPTANHSEANSNNTLQDGDYDEADLSDYVNLVLTDSDPSNSSVHNTSVSEGSGRNVRSLRSVFNSTSEANNDTDSKQQHSWAFSPTVPTVTAKDNTDQRIVGGDEATPGEIPWQVALVSYIKETDKMLPFCGGSLLSELWVITAAHCLVKENEIAQHYSVVVGEHDINKEEGSERSHLVEKYYIHPSYNYKKSPYNHDIALLKLAKPVELSSQRRPICLGPKHFIENILRESSSSLVSGWGALRFQGLKASTLQKLEVPYVDRTVCKQSSRDHITQFMFCAGYENERKDSCQGDSGGPHATSYKGTWFLTGIVSWGEECAREGRYGIYTRLSRYYNWISNTTKLYISN